jgi:hypothetical protein
MIAHSHYEPAAESNRKETTRQQRELEAESVSYAVLAAKQPATLFDHIQGADYIFPRECSPAENVFPKQSPDKTWQIGVQLLLQHRRNKPPSFDLILAEGSSSRSAEVFRFFIVRLSEVPFLVLIVLVRR